MPTFDQTYEAALNAVKKAKKPSVAVQKAKFEKLRAQYLKQENDFTTLEREVAIRRGRVEYASESERKKLDSLRDRKWKTGSKFYPILEEVSPRRWESGVPAWWIHRELSWEDAIRPLNERLSVTPPLAYGATEAMR